MIKKELLPKRKPRKVFTNVVKNILSYQNDQKNWKSKIDLKAEAYKLHRILQSTRLDSNMILKKK